MEQYFRYLEKLAGLQIVNVDQTKLFLEARFLMEPEEAEDIVLIWLLSREAPSRPGQPLQFR